jgi:chloramphenicol 3-O-phosphotransferase
MEIKKIQALALQELLVEPFMHQMDMFIMYSQEMEHSRH